MAKISIVGDAIVVTSSAKLEDIRTIAKYNAAALVLMGGEEGKTPIFGVTHGDKGELTQHGAVFASETRDDDKLATITLSIPANATGDITEWVADKYGKAITYLARLEATLPDVLAAIVAERNAVKANITVVQ